MTKQPDNRATHIRSDHSPEKDIEAQTKVKEAHARSSEATTDDPAAERGERMESGKAVARAGKSEGKVPGTDNKPKK